MSFELIIGSWVIPLFVTVIAVWGASLKFVHPGDYGVGHIINLIFLGAAVIVSLIAWLIWAVLT
jgi:hypothetical protein